MKLQMIKCQSIQEMESRVLEYLNTETKGKYGQLTKPIVYNGKGFNPFSKKSSYSVIPNTNRSSIYIKRFSTGKDIMFFTKNIQYKTTANPKTKPSIIEQNTKEFNSYSKEHRSHPYFNKKQISPNGLNIRYTQDNKIAIPIYNKTGEIVSIQYIDSSGFKLFKENAKLGDTPHFPIGQVTKSVFLCEGIATAQSIHNITKQRVYACFSKVYIDKLIQYLLDKYPSDIKIIVCLDHDRCKTTGSDTTHSPNTIDKRVIFLRPDNLGDFNDFQNTEFEINKLKNLAPTYNPPKKEITFTPNPNDPVADLRARLDVFNYELRYNTRKESIEIKNFTIKNQWTNISDEAYSSLYLYLQTNIKTSEGEPCKIKKSIFEDSLKALAFETKVDPFKVYLESLKWDNTQRLTTYLSELFTIEQGYKQLAEWFFKAVLLAAVWRTYHPGYKFDVLGILVSEQGLGKSTLIYNLFKDKSFVSSNFVFAQDTKVVVEQTLGKVICEASELVGFRKVEIERMKAILSSQQDTTRLSYRKNPLDYPRKCVFIGTSNDQDCLPNDLQLRRFVVISISKNLEYQELKDKIVKDRDQLWAEALKCFKEKEDPNLPPKLWKISAEIAEQHRGGDSVLEEKITDYVEDHENNTNAHGIIMDKLLNDISIPATTVNQRACGQILRRLGYEKKRLGKRKITRWVKFHRNTIKDSENNPTNDPTIINNNNDMYP